jgi:hypothetical protein
MADDIPEVTVSGQTPVLKKPPSAWKVGLLYSLVGGPFAGVAAGIIQHSRNKSALEKEAAYQDERTSLDSTINSELAIGDDDEKRMLKYAKGLRVTAFEQMAAGNRQAGEQLLTHARELVENIMTGDIQQRKKEESQKNDFQRGLIGDAAKGYRQEYQNSVDAFNAIDHQSLKVLDLVSQKNFDPNNPLNKAHLAELISMGGMMFKDTPDLAEGIAQSIGSINGIAGGIAGGIATMLKSENFKTTPEMYNTIALNMQKYAKILAERKTGQLGDQAKQLDMWGKKLGVIPEDYSLGDYISGGEKELRMTPNPVFTGGYKDTEDKVKDYISPTEQLGGGGRFRGHGATSTWGPPVNGKRPTN